MTSPRAADPAGRGARRWAGLVPLLCLALAGCQSGGTTRLSDADLTGTTGTMAASLVASDFLAGRSADSPPLVVVVDRVENLSSDIVPPAEQRALMAALVGSRDVADLARAHGVTFVPPGLEPPSSATHALRATFRSRTRVRRGGEGGRGHVTARSDAYHLEYRIVDLGTGAFAWSDAIELKRATTGLLID